MIRRSSMFIVVTLAAAVMGANAFAGCPPDIAYSTAYLIGSAPEVSVFTVPDGTGRPLTNCFEWGGGPANVQIEVYLGDALGPCVGYPNRRVQINKGSPTQVWCSGSLYPPASHKPNCADSATSGAGFTYFSNSYHGGGHTWMTRVYVFNGIGWNYLPTVLDNVHFNSADMNGDLVVDLTDVSLFVPCWYTVPIPYECDFCWDGVGDLSDVVLMAMAYGRSCP